MAVMTDFLERYLHRIGLAAPLAPDLPALRAVVAAHTRAIPFENLDPWTGRDVPLDDDALAAKLVDGGRGGYCFEQNAVLRRALDALGFTTTGLAARVTIGRAPGDPPGARSHMLLRVELPQGPHVVDVGFGGQVLTGVLALDEDGPQDTPHEPYRLTREADGVRALAALVAGRWRELYRFDPLPAETADYEVANFWVSRHPRSRFVTGLIAARVAPDRRYALGGTRLAVHHLGGPSEQRELTSPAEVREVLERDLLVDTSGLPDLDAHLARLFPAGPTEA